MPDFKSLAAFNAEVGKMQEELVTATRRRVTRAQGELAQKIATAAASAVLGGDPKFSGWPPELDTQLKSTSRGDTIMSPTRSSAGPWTVAFIGRNQGNAAGFSGWGLSRKTGLTSRTKSGALRKVRATKSRRWNGTTKGKISDAALAAKIDVATRAIPDVMVRKTIARRFDVT